MKRKRWVEDKLGELGFVDWDRYFKIENGLVFYGWIKREQDEYKDFVVLELNTEAEIVVRYDSSSAKYSEEIGDILGFSDHSKCHRVEEELSIDNMVEVDTE